MASDAIRLMAISQGIPKGPILLTWMKFNLSKYKLSHTQASLEWNYLSIPKIQRLLGYVIAW